MANSPAARVSRKTYGLPTLTMLVIASMVGTGVFTTSGFTLGAVGSPLRVMLCWTIGGVIAICGAVGYGRLAGLLPESGGEYLYLSRHVHPLAGFLAGWVSLTAGFSGAIATAAVGFESYAIPETARPHWLPPDTIAVVVVVLCGLLHGVEKVWGKYFQNAVVLIKVVALAAFVALVVVRIPEHPWQLHQMSPDAPGGFKLVTAIATSVVWISLSYAGFNAAIYVASESFEARRVVPQALLLGTVAVVVLYLVLNLIFVTSTTAEQLVWKEDIAAVAAHAIGGRHMELLVRCAVALGLLSSVSGMVLTGPRVYSQMADDGVFPELFRADRQGISKSIALQTAIAVGLILLQRVLVSQGWLESSLLGLLIYLSTTLSLTSACCVATLFLPSVRHADPDRSARHTLAAAVYVVATLLAMVLLMISHQQDGQTQGVWHLTGAAATFATGIIAWFVVGRRRPTA
ncbi:MAG: APC family permease [Fuerstiella sp.]